MNRQDRPAPTFDEIEDMARAYMQSKTILTAVELDVFTKVGARGGTAAEIATRTETHARAMEMLLNALVALGLLDKREGRFFRNALAESRLSSDSPEDGRSSLLHLAHIWDNWSALTACVRRGTSAGLHEHAERDDSWTRAFIGAMHQFALEQAAPFVDAMDLTDTRRVLDLGGGSGAYAIAFCRRGPDIRATVFDLPTAVPLTREHVAEAGLSERIDIQAGDLCSDEFGSDYDLVWISSICHMFGPEENIALFRKASASLGPNGRIAVRDFIMDDDKTSPRFGAIFALNMLVNTARGSSWSRAEYAGWLREAGFGAPAPIEVSGAGNAALLVARKANGG